MTATILPFPSRGLAGERGERSRQHPPPHGNFVEVVRLDLPFRQQKDLALDRRVGIAEPLFVTPDRADGATKLFGEPCLRPSRFFTPRRQFHSETSPARSLPKWLYGTLALWQYANMANGQIVYIRRVANDDAAPNRIQELLASQGMTQAELARLANVTVSALNKVIKGTRGLDQEWMRRLAPHLKVSPAALLPLDDNPLILSDVEREIIERYRSADRSTQAQLERVSEALMPFGDRPKAA